MIYYSYYINFPVAIIEAMGMEKGEEFPR